MPTPTAPHNLAALIVYWEEEPNLLNPIPSCVLDLMRVVRYRADSGVIQVGGLTWVEVAVAKGLTVASKRRFAAAIQTAWPELRLGTAERSFLPTSRRLTRKGITDLTLAIEEFLTPSAQEPKTAWARLDEDDPFADAV